MVSPQFLLSWLITEYYYLLKKAVLLFYYQFYHGLVPSNHHSFHSVYSECTFVSWTLTRLTPRPHPYKGTYDTINPKSLTDPNVQG